MKEQLIKRLRNKAFLVSMVSAILLLTQQLGLDIFPSNFQDIINTILVILTITGVIVDPTTPGITDGEVKTE